ncbi:MAG TPA: ethanolamine ammonia-lyase subunit EutC [Nevskiaceae bacterium]|nr:ethanolamine ammonia-lyase subunit EutC [Nevskiaceae bacterium]
MKPPVESTPGAVAEDAWSALRRYTPARIGLGRAGDGLPTREVLDFGMAHARARDAVHTPLDVPALRATLEADGWAVIEVTSRAPDRAAYLARPDWGRQLSDDGAAALAACAMPAADLVLVVSDGLSSIGVERHAPGFLRAARAALPEARFGPVVIATQARVALADAVGERLGARFVASVIGERPGLSAPDSLGVYLTFGPRPGRTDAERNCISNIHGQGLTAAQAAAQLAALVRAGAIAGRTGVGIGAAPASLALPGVAGT